MLPRAAGGHRTQQLASHTGYTTLESASQSLLGDPILVGRSGSHTACCCDPSENLPPNRRMKIIRRMNAYAQERLALQESEQRCVPGATEGTAPIVFNAIDQRSCRKYVARAEITDGAQACGVFHLRVAGGPLGFIGKQPRRRHETCGLSPCARNYRARMRATQSFVITEVVKLALVLRKSCQNCRAKFLSHAEDVRGNNCG